MHLLLKRQYYIIRDRVPTIIVLYYIKLRGVYYNNMDADTQYIVHKCCTVGEHDILRFCVHWIFRNLPCVRPMRWVRYCNVRTSRPDSKNHFSAWIEQKRVVHTEKKNETKRLSVKRFTMVIAAVGWPCSTYIHR